MSSDGKVLTAIFAGMLFISACEWAWRARRLRKSQNWLLVQALVTETAIHKDKHALTLIIRFSYSVPDEPYPVPAEFRKSFPPGYDQEIERWSEALDQKQVPARVDPSNHWRSTLWESDLKTIVLANSAELTTEADD